MQDNMPFVMEFDGTTNHTFSMVKMAGKHLRCDRQTGEADNIK